MSTITPEAQAQELTGPELSQARFRAMFDHEPLVDTRTPADVRAQALRENWK